MNLWFMLHATDACEFVEELPASSVDLFVTDPAYESLEKHRAVGTTTRLKKEWFPIFPNARFDRFFHGVYRAMKPDSHCYVMCDQETAFTVAVAAGQRAGLTFWKALIWDKVAIGMGYHYRAQHELVLFFEKGSRQLNNKGTSDILSFKRLRNGYPTEKPVELSRVLIDQSSKLGDVVVDPFMGSGSVGEAALSIGRHFIGNDVVNEQFGPVRDRLEDFGRYVIERPAEEFSLYSP